MSQQQPTVSDIFRRAQAMRHEHSDWSLKQLKDALVKEFSGAPFPPLHNLTIPEQKEVIDGILLSLEQTENYERARGPEGDRDEWHDRSVGINEAVAKGVGKWMPEELK
jgi:hypothetical protein